MSWTYSEGATPSSDNPYVVAVRTGRRADTGNPYTVTAATENDATENDAMETTLLQSSDPFTLTTASMLVEANIIEPHQFEQAEYLLKNISDAKKRLEEITTSLSSAMQRHLVGQDPATDFQVMTLYEHLVKYKQGQLDLSYNTASVAEINRDIAAIAKIDVKEMVELLRDICRGEIWLDDSISDFDKVKQCYTMLQNHMNKNDFRTLNAEETQRDYNAQLKIYNQKSKAFEKLDEQIFQNLLVIAARLWDREIVETSAPEPKKGNQLTQKLKQSWASMDDLIESIKSHAGLYTGNIEDCVVQKFFQEHGGDDATPYEPCKKNHKKARGDRLTGNEHIPQLKLELSLRIAILEYLQTCYDTRRKTESSFTMDKQLENTVIVYVGSHHSHEDMKRSQIHMLLDQFPLVKFVLVDYDQRSLWMHEAIHADHQSRVHVVTCKFSETIAENVGKYLDSNQLDILFLSDIRSDLNLNAIQNHTRMLACCLAQAKMCTDDDNHRDLLLHDAAQFALNLVELQLERESTVARDDNQQAFWLSKMKCMARLKFTMPYKINAANVFFKADETIQDIEKKFPVPFGNCFLTLQPFSGNSTEINTIIKPGKMRKSMDWNEDKLKKFVELFRASPYYTEKTTYGRHNRMEGGDLKIHGYIFPKKPLPLENSQDEEYTLQEWDEKIEMLNVSGKRNILIPFADAMFNNFKAKITDGNLRNKCRPVHELDAYHTLKVKHDKTYLQNYADRTAFHALKELDRRAQEPVVQVLNDFVSNLQVDEEMESHFKQNMFSAGRGGQRMQLIQVPVNKFMECRLDDFVVDTMSNIAETLANAAKYYLAIIIDPNRSRKAKGGLDIKHPFGVPVDMQYFKVVILAHFQRLQLKVKLEDKDKQTDLKSLSTMIYISLAKHTRLDKGFMPREKPLPRQEYDSLTEDEKTKQMQKDKEHQERREKWFASTKDYHEMLPMWLCCKVCYILTHLFDLNTNGLREMCLEKLANVYMQAVQNQCQEELDRIKEKMEKKRKHEMQAITRGEMSSGPFYQTLSIMPYTVSIFHIANNDTREGITLTRSYHIEMFPFLMTFGPKTSVDVWKQYNFFIDGWKIRLNDKSVLQNAEMGQRQVIETVSEHNVFDWPNRRSLFLCLCERGVYRVVEYILQQVKREIATSLQQHNVNPDIVDDLVQWNLSDYIDMKGQYKSVLQTCLQSAAFYGHYEVVNVLLNEYSWFSSTQCRKFYDYTGTYTILQDMDLILNSKDFKSDRTDLDLKIHAPYPRETRLISSTDFRKIRNRLMEYFRKQRHTNLRATVTSDVYRANIEYREKLRTPKPREEKPPMDENIILFDLENDLASLTPVQIQRASSLFTGVTCPVKISSKLWKLVSADAVALYSLTPAICAEETCTYLHESIDLIQRQVDGPHEKWTILDMTAGAGGDTSAFMYTRHFKEIYAIEISKARFGILKNVMQVYRENFVQASDVKVNLINGNSFDLICVNRQEQVTSSLVEKNGRIQQTRTPLAKLRNEVQVVFIDPPWGGKDYLLNSMMNDFNLFSSIKVTTTDGKEHEECKDGKSLREVVTGIIAKCNALRIIFIKLPQNLIQSRALEFSNVLASESMANGWQFKKIVYGQNSMLQGFSLLQFGRRTDPPFVP